MTSLNASSDTVIHHIQPGDTLQAIVNRYYGNLPPQKRQEVIQRIVATNRSAKSAGTIYANQLLKLEVPRQYSAAQWGFSTILGMC